MKTIRCTGRFHSIRYVFVKRAEDIEFDDSTFTSHRLRQWLEHMQWKLCIQRRNGLVVMLRCPTMSFPPTLHTYSSTPKALTTPLTLLIQATRWIQRRVGVTAGGGNRCSIPRRHLTEYHTSGRGDASNEWLTERLGEWIPLRFTCFTASPAWMKPELHGYGRCVR